MRTAAMRNSTFSIAAIAALALAGCSSDDGEEPPATETETETVAPEPSATADPPEPEPEGQWAEPVEAEEVVGEAFDTDEPAAVRWLEVGSTLQIVVTGSGSIDCVPTPIDAWTDGQQVEVEFEAPDPDATCTMDIQTHAWTVTWDEPIEVNSELPLFLTNVEDDGEQFDTQLPAEPVE